MKSSVTKSKLHSKEKSSVIIPPLPVTLTLIKADEITVSESKPSKSKKSTVIPSNVVKEIDIPSTTPDNSVLSSSSGPNSVISNNKQKIKTTKKTKKTTTQQHPAFYFDDAGNQVWICPTCGKQDDGSPMIGCDGCDAWYHWYVKSILSFINIHCKVFLIKMHVTIK